MNSRPSDGQSDDDSVQHRLIQDFKSLSTKQARRAVLHAILDDLSFDEQRELAARQKYRLHCDIVGSLPLELVLHIARYLDPLEAWVFQRVSKRWQSVFSSKEIYSAIQFPFYPSPLPDSGDKNLSATDIMRCKYGFYRTAACYHWPEGLDCSFKDTSTAEQSISYSSGRLAWLSSDQRIACVRDLTTGAVTQFLTETRGVISLIHLSENYLFVQASGYCTAWELLTHRSHQIRLPSPHILEINDYHGRVIILIGRHSDHSTILSWHLGSDSVRSSRIDGQPLLTCWSDDGDAQQNTFSVIQAKKEPGEPGWEESYCFFKQDFCITDHEVTAHDTKILAIDQKFDIDFQYFLTFAKFNKLICRYGTRVSQVLPLNYSEPGLINIFIAYSMKPEALKVRAPVHKLEDDKQMQYHKGKMLTLDGTFYYPNNTWSHFKVNQILDKTEIFYAHFRSKTLLMGSPNRPSFVTFGNHQLFGVAHTAGIDIWSFDPKLQLSPNA